MANTCRIHFVDNDYGVYYSGQLLTGHVVLNLTKAKRLRGIFVQIMGEAYGSWEEGSGDDKRAYSGNELYLNKKTFLIGGPNGVLTMEPGIYTYNFNCQLPLGLPSSLETETGYIRYRIKVEIVIPFWSNENFEIPFTVMRPLNLNYDATYRLPLQNEGTYNFSSCCSFCFGSTELAHVVVRIPAAGYIPGDTISIEIVVDNKSNAVITCIAQLRKKVTFYTRANSRNTKNEEFVICQQNRIGVNHGNATNIFHTMLIVPPTPPTDESNSNICKVIYVLRVVTSAVGFHKKGVIDIPITIGTYPMLDNQNVQLISTMPRSHNPILPIIITGRPYAPITRQPIARGAHKCNSRSTMPVPLFSGDTTQLPMFTETFVPFATQSPFSNDNFTTSTSERNDDPPTYSEVTDTTATAVSSTNDI